MRHAEENGLEKVVDIRGHFCFEQCDNGPSVTVDGQHIEQCSLEWARELLDQRVASLADGSSHDAND